jgi:hypothetical protein
LRSGEVYRHEAFYLNVETGELEAKYFLLFATPPSGDAVARLLTSRQHGRPENPPCFHGHPYSSFYLGVLGGPLSAKSWVDLRYLDDFDGVELQRRLKTKRISLVMRVPIETLTDVLACAAGADDTTRFQERAIRDELSRLR